MNMTSSMPISEIRKAFHNEWLLVAVDSVDETTTTPVTGTLVDHAASPEPLLEEASKSQSEMLVIFSEDWPDDLAACF